MSFNMVNQDGSLTMIPGTEPVDAALSSTSTNPIMNKEVENHKTEKSDIATVETGTSASKAYTVGEEFYLENVRYKALTDIASGTAWSALTLDTDYEVAGDVSSQIRTIANDISGLTNPNLLDNPWFTVNQRGQTSYTTVGYTVDRWKLKLWSGTSASVDITNSGLSMTRVASGMSLCLLTQDVKIPIKAGQTITLSMLVTAVSHEQVAPSMFIRTLGDSNLKNKPIRQGMNTVSYTAQSDLDGVQICFGHHSSHGGVKGFSITVRAIKLELGSVSTLANDVMPDYVEELAKCRASTADSSDTYANQGDYIQASAQGILGAKNLLPNRVATQVINDVTLTVNSDGSITANGTASADISLEIGTTATIASALILSGGISANQKFRARDVATSTDYNDTGSSATLPSNKYFKVFLEIASGEALTNVVFYPMIRPASIADDTYVPYAKTNQELTGIDVWEDITDECTFNANVTAKKILYNKALKKVSVYCAISSLNNGGGVVGLPSKCSIDYSKLPLLTYYQTNIISTYRFVEDISNIPATDIKYCAGRCVAMSNTIHCYFSKNTPAYGISITGEIIVK